MRRSKIRAVWSIAKYGVLILAVLVLGMYGICRIAIPSEQTVFSEDADGLAVFESVCGEVECGEYTVTAKLFGAIPIKDITVNVVPEMTLVPGGDVFGVKFFTKGVIIIGSTEIETTDGFISPAEKAGLRKSDIITKVNGQEINTVEELAELVTKSGGKPLFVEYLREENVQSCEVQPVLSRSDNAYKTGIWVRDSTAGIGTVTYYNPQNGSFAGLGHGICDVDTGKLMPLLRGSIVEVGISDIVKGKSGSPGELKGVFDSEKIGTLIGNTSCGVYGIMDHAPESISGALAVAKRKDVHAGDATIRVNADGKGIKEYAVKLSKVDTSSDGTKCFVVEIVDPALLGLTGGIVQGMSGSPIIQDGKLCGALTHVLVGDPTKGYGIFIENMLERMPEMAK